MNLQTIRILKLNQGFFFTKATFQNCRIHTRGLTMTVSTPPALVPWSAGLAAEPHPSSSSSAPFIWSVNGSGVVFPPRQVSFRGVDLGVRALHITGESREIPREAKGSQQPPPHGAVIRERLCSPSRRGSASRRCCCYHCHLRSMPRFLVWTQSTFQLYHCFTRSHYIPPP